MGFGADLSGLGIFQWLLWSDSEIAFLEAEAAAADRAARMSSSNAALAASAESEAAREWKRQAAEARRAEAKAMAGQQRAELAAQQARKDHLRGVRFGLVWNGLDTWVESYVSCKLCDTPLYVVSYDIISCV